MKVIVLLCAVLLAAGCATKTKTATAYRTLPAKKVPIIDTAKINPAQSRVGRPWVPPEIIKAESVKLRAMAAVEPAATNRITIQPEGTGFRFNAPHATNEPGQIWFTIEADPKRRRETGDSMFLSFNAYDTPTNSTSYAPNAANSYGKPPKVFGEWIGRGSAIAKSIAVQAPSFETQFAEAKKKLGRDAKNYGMRPDGTLVRLN